MLATFDLPAVSRFAAELKERQRQCGNGEGMFCSSLDESIKCLADLCRDLLFTLKKWATAVFKGQVVFDQQVEAEFQAQVRDLLPHAKRVAAEGREKNWMCFELQGLNELHYWIAELDYLREHWVSPRLAVAPSPRVSLPDAAERQISERLRELPPLPPDWRPSDPEQIAWYQKQLTE
jgi:hypothetical protein